MPRDPGKYLYDMDDAATFLLDFTARQSIDRFRSDRPFRSAVERELLIIGEALFQLERHHPTIAERISEYQRIIRFRHVLVHGYDQIDADLVWVVVSEKLTVLRDEVRTLLSESST